MTAVTLSSSSTRLEEETHLDGHAGATSKEIDKSISHVKKGHEANEHRYEAARDTLW